MANDDVSTPTKLVGKKIAPIMEWREADVCMAESMDIVELIDGDERLGPTGVIKPALELTEHHWDWTMGINAGILLPLVQHAKPMMRPGASVVAVSSLGALRAIPLYAAVGASKAALESLVRHLAIELAAEKIRVNAVSAGVVATDALKHFPHRDDIIGNSQVKTPAGRLTEPDDVADVILFLVSPLAGVAADRYNRKRLLILSDLARSLAVFGFLFVRRPQDIWLLYVLTAIQLGISGVFFPTRNAILPDIVSSKSLGAANAL